MRTKMRARGFTTDASFCIHRAGKILKTRDAIESTNTDETTLLKERHQYLPAIFLYFNALQNKFCLWEKRKKIASKIPFRGLFISRFVSSKGVCNKFASSVLVVCGRYVFIFIYYYY